MSGDHTKYHGTAEVVNGELTYDPETGEPLVDGYPLYSGLPKREWVGLSDLDIDDIKQNAPIYVSAKAVNAIVPMVEAKLKEKNT